jgi:hypothetical protein
MTKNRSMPGSTLFSCMLLLEIQNIPSMIFCTLIFLHPLGANQKNIGKTTTRNKQNPPSGSYTCLCVAYSMQARARQSLQDPYHAWHTDKKKGGEGGREYNIEYKYAMRGFIVNE